MKRITLLLFSILLGVGIYFGYKFLFPNSKDQVLKQMKLTEKLISFPVDENPIGIAARIKKLEDLISPTAGFAFQSQAANLRFTGLSELKPKMMMAKQYFHYLKLSWKDIEFISEPQNNMAEIRASALIEGQLKNSSEKFLEASPFKIRFQKFEDHWLITSMENENILQFR